MISRRDVLKALPALAVAPSLLGSVAAAPVANVVQFSKWLGIGKDHAINESWADRWLEGGETHLVDLEDNDNLTILRCTREAWLPEEYADYFTSSGNHIWHGPVRLVRDLIHRRRDNHTWANYYTCRSDESIQGRQLPPEEVPLERWIHIG
jgi:hypothetical protein